MNRAAKQQGFSLLELMIVIGIVGILSAIAIPGYANYMRKAHRNDMQSAMMQHAQELERCYSHYNKYTACSIATEYSESSHCADAQLECPYAFYNLKIDPLDDRTFTLTAVPTGDQVKDKCGELTLDQTGKRGTNSGLPVRDCWK